MNKRSLTWVALAMALVLASWALPLLNGRTQRGLLVGMQALAAVACLRQGVMLMKAGSTFQAAIAFAAALFAATAAAVAWLHLL